MKVKPKAANCCIPKAVLKTERGQTKQLPPTTSTPINQRKQLAGTSL